MSWAEKHTLHQSAVATGKVMEEDGSLLGNHITVFWVKGSSGHSVLFSEAEEYWEGKTIDVQDITLWRDNIAKKSYMLMS